MIGVILLQNGSVIGDPDGNPIGQRGNTDTEVRLDGKLIGRGPTGAPHRQIIALPTRKQRRKINVESARREATCRQAGNHRHRVGLRGIWQSRGAVEHREQTARKIDQGVGGPFGLQRNIHQKVADILTHDVGGEGDAIGQPEGRRIGGHEGEAQLPVQQEARFTTSSIGRLQFPQPGAGLTHEWAQRFFRLIDQRSAILIEPNLPNLQTRREIGGRGRGRGCHEANGGA